MPILIRRLRIHRSPGETGVLIGLCGELFPEATADTFCLPDEEHFTDKHLAPSGEI
jgi:hypothetical protein